MSPSVYQPDEQWQIRETLSTVKDDDEVVRLKCDYIPFKAGDFVVVIEHITIKGIECVMVWTGRIRIPRCTIPVEHLIEYVPMEQAVLT